MKPIDFPAAATQEQVAAAEIIIENSRPEGSSCDVIYDDETSDLVIVFEDETPPSKPLASASVPTSLRG